MARGPRDGLDAMAPLAEALDGYHLYHSARADLHRRLDERDEAAAAYRRALQLVGTAPERSFLEDRLKELTGS